MRDRIFNAGLALLVCCSAGCFGVDPNDRLAWEALVEISRPADAGGALDNETRVTWRLWATKEEIYPVGDNLTPSIPPSGINAGFTRLHCGISAQQQMFSAAQHENGSDGAAPCEAIFLNQPATQYMLANRIYLRGPMISLASTGGIHLPSGQNGPNVAREIKTEWRPISASQSGRYVVAMSDSSKAGPYGLVAIHLMTHEAADWVWATWIHEDFAKDVQLRDSFGRVKDGKISPALGQLLKNANEPFLEHYRLIGTQSDFKPKSLGNPQIERGMNLKCSSCMGCHRYAAVTGSGGWQPLSPCKMVGVVPPPAGMHPTDFDYTLTREPECHGAAQCQTALEVR